MCKHNVGTRTAVLCIPMGHKTTEKSPLRNTGQKNNPRPSTHAAYHLSPLAAQETCQNRGQRTKQGLFQVRSCDRPSGCFVEAQIPVAPSLNAFCTYEKQTNTHPCLQGRYLEHLQRGLLPSHTGFHLAAPAATYPLPPGHGGAPALRTALSAPARWHSTAGMRVPSCLTWRSPSSEDPGTPAADAAGTAVSPRGSRRHGTVRHSKVRHGTAPPAAGRALSPARPSAACWQAARPTGARRSVSPSRLSRPTRHLQPETPRTRRLPPGAPGPPAAFFPTCSAPLPADTDGMAARRCAAPTAPAPQRRPPASQHRLSAPPAPLSQRLPHSAPPQRHPWGLPASCLGGAARGSAGRDPKTGPEVLVSAPLHAKRASSLYYFTLFLFGLWESWKLQFC